MVWKTCICAFNLWLIRALDAIGCNATPANHVPKAIAWIPRSKQCSPPRFNGSLWSGAVLYKTVTQAVVVADASIDRGLRIARFLAIKIVPDADNWPNQARQPGAASLAQVHCGQRKVEV